MKNKYSVLITLLNELSVDNLIAAMFRFGYALAPLADHGYLLKGDNSSTTILGMSVVGSNIDHIKLRNYIRQYLIATNTGFYSIVVMEGQPNIAWAVTNMSDNKTVRPTAKTVKNVPYLRLLKKTPPPLPTENPQGE